MRVLVTGGAGFIGSALIRMLVADHKCNVLNIDKLTYAGSLTTVENVAKSDRYSFQRLDICDRAGMRKVFEEFSPDLVLHLAAESHVDRSIDESSDFIQTNIVGTHVLLEVARNHWGSLPASRGEKFRFVHISTDEVFGDLTDSVSLFSESTPYAPNSPYSSSKAASDHLVRAWHRTYGLPTITTHCSNNYGPFQFPEKFIPVMVLNAIAGQPLPIYGDGQQVRDWLYVDDHVRAIWQVANAGQVGETYNIGGHNEKSNLEVVKAICSILEDSADFVPLNAKSAEGLITFVEDRPGHDRRYAIDASKIEAELGWRPIESFDSGLRRTVEWIMKNRDWYRLIADSGVPSQRRGRLVKETVE